jgi:hypothetical protein
MEVGVAYWKTVYRSTELLFNRNVTFRDIKVALGGTYSTYSRKMKCGHDIVSRTALGRLGHRKDETCKIIVDK